jgi:hypothetical protein
MFHEKLNFFIVTAGEDTHPDAVIRYVSAHRQKIRCFTITLGQNSDFALMKNIATCTNGRFDLVEDGLDIETKIIPQLLAAVTIPIEDVSVRVIGCGWQNVVNSPIQSFTPQRLSTIFVQCQNLEQDWRVLTTGVRDGHSYESITRPTLVCADATMITAVSKYVDLIRLQNFEHEIRDGRRTRTIKARNLLIREAVGISVRSGILCSYTIFVGVVQQDAPNAKQTRIYVWCGGSCGYLCILLNCNDLSPQKTINEAVALQLQLSSDAFHIEFPGTRLNDFHDCQILRCKVNQTNPIEINVRTPKGKYLVILAWPQETIMDLKILIDKREGISPDDQRLVMAQIELNCNNTIEDYLCEASLRPHLQICLEYGKCDSICRVSDMLFSVTEPDIAVILSDYSVDGLWTKADKILEKLGQPAPSEPSFHMSDQDGKFSATLRVLRILRTRYEHHQDIWQLLEFKAIMYFDHIIDGQERTDATCVKG